MSLNRVTLIGHLGQDPELRHLPTGGQPVASFSIATDDAYADRQGHRQERVDWHNIVVFGKAFESCEDEYDATHAGPRCWCRSCLSNLWAGRRRP